MTLGTFHVLDLLLELDFLFDSGFLLDLGQLLAQFTIASMPSPLCRSQILIGSEFGQYIPTVVHTVRELQL